jgi:VanZ family protein
MMKAVRMSAWLLTLAIVILSLVPPELRPRLGGLHALEHFVIFSATGLAFGLGYRPRYSTAIGLVLFAGAIELAQLFVPGRHARLSDFIVDALAACIGLAASQVVAPKQPIRHRSLTLTWHIYESPACAWH